MNYHHRPSASGVELGDFKTSPEQTPSADRTERQKNGTRKSSELAEVATAVRAHRRTA